MSLAVRWLAPSGKPPPTCCGVACAHCFRHVGARDGWIILELCGYFFCFLFSFFSFFVHVYLINIDAGCGRTDESTYSDRLWARSSKTSCAPRALPSVMAHLSRSTMYRSPCPPANF